MFFVMNSLCLSTDLLVAIKVIIPSKLHVYGTEIEISAGFGPVGNTEKKLGPIMSIFCGCFFHVFMGKKN